MSRGNLTNLLSGTRAGGSRESGGSGFGWSRGLVLSVCIVSFVVLLSAMVYCLLKRKRVKQLRHRLVPLYHFDAGECEDWEEELMEDPGNEKATYYRSITSPKVMNSF